MQKLVITSIVCLFLVVTTLGQSLGGGETSIRESQRWYIGLWDGQIVRANGTVDIALNFARLEDGSLVGEILFKTPNQGSRFNTVAVTRDGSITFELRYPNGSVLAFEGKIQSDGKLAGTNNHSLGTQSLKGTFSATRRAKAAATATVTAPQIPKMTDAQIAEANAAADKIAVELAAAIKSPSDEITMFGITVNKYFGAEQAGIDCVKKFPGFARCYEARGQAFATEERDPDVTSQNLKKSDPPNYFKLAEADLTRAITLEPTSKSFYLSRGKFYLEARFGRPDLALKDAEAALRIDPTYAPAKTLLADAQKKLALK